VLAIAGSLLARGLAERDARRDSDRRVELAAALIGSRIGEASSLASSFRRFISTEGAGGVTNDEFARIALRWLSPAEVPAAAWVEEIPAGERAGYERRLGHVIVTPERLRAPEPPRSSYLPATLVSGYPPIDVRGIDLGREPGMLEAITGAESPGGVATTPFAARRDGTSGLFLVAQSANVIHGQLRPGAVVIFVSEATLRAAARSPAGLEFVAAGSPPRYQTGADTVREEVPVPGGRLAVVMPRASVTGAGAVLPWLILAAGLVLAALAGALGVNAARRAKAQADLDRIFNLSPDLIAVADFNGYFTRLNPASERILGYTEHELLARPYRDFVHPEDRERTAAEETAISGGKTTLSFENRYVRKDGSERVLDWTATPVVDEGVMYAMARDVTERRKAEWEVERLADEQAALRRVATLVAEGVPSDQLFAGVTKEVAHVFSDVDPQLVASVIRFDPGPESVLVGASRAYEDEAIGSRWSPKELYVSTRVLRTGRPARVDEADLDAIGGPDADALRLRGFLYQVASPVVVEGLIWGAMCLNSKEALPPDTDRRLASFVELIATAIANAENRSELAASRKRLVAASDDARRRIERDLHDGVQQQLVSLGLTLGKMEAAQPAGGTLKEQLAGVSDDVGSILDSLVEIARGIHPAILSQGGLEAALNGLVRRSSVPVEIDAQIDGGPLPGAVEVAAYYAVSEALTNVAKHARASVVHVDVTTDDGTLTLVVRDDGIGGATLGEGSGLVGLQDRVEALGGTITIDSSAGEGTCVAVTLPIAVEPHQEIEKLLVRPQEPEMPTARAE
jgi:PAS domain S-box-containing protein